MSNKQLPIDFPSNPDVTFSGAPMVFKERGLRGKAGSAPPFDLGKVAFSLSADRLNTLNFGHTGPTPSKKKDHAKVDYLCGKNADCSDFFSKYVSPRSPPKKRFWINSCKYQHFPLKTP